MLAFKPLLAGNRREGVRAATPLKNRLVEKLPPQMLLPADVTFGFTVGTKRGVSGYDPPLMAGMGSQALQCRPYGSRFVSLVVALSQIVQQLDGLFVQRKIKPSHRDVGVESLPPEPDGAGAGCWCIGGDAGN